MGCGGNLEIRAEFCRCTGARFWRSCHQSRVNERSESNRRHQASLSTFEVQGAAGRAVAIARCSVRRHRASCSSLDLSKTSSASVARTGPKKSHSEIISLSALPRRYNPTKWDSRKSSKGTGERAGEACGRRGAASDAQRPVKHRTEGLPPRACGMRHMWHACTFLHAWSLRS